MIQSPRSAGAHLPSLFLALISGFGVLIGLLAAAYLTLLILQQPVPSGTLVPLAWAAVLLALLNLPALIYSAPRVFGRPASRWQFTRGWRWASIALGFWVFDLLLASLLAGGQSLLTRLLLPPLSILAVAIPLWWLVELGRRGLRTTPQRTWGAVTTSLMGTIPLVIFVELLGFLFLGILIIMWLLGSSPDLFEQMQGLTQSIANGNAGAERMLSLLQPYLDRPGVLLIGVLILSVLTPLVEEFFKPLALWLIAGRQLSEAEGFTLGMVAGAIFALLETLGTLPGLSGRGDLWLALVLTRTGTGLLHVVCSGLVGWGLAAAWTHARYVRLAGLYLLAVVVHGSWNLFAQLLSLGKLLPEDSLGATLGHAAPFMMGGLALLMAVGLVQANRYLQAHQPPLPVEPPVLPPPVYWGYPPPTPGAFVPIETPTLPQPAPVDPGPDLNTLQR